MDNLNVLFETKPISLINRIAIDVGEGRCLQLDCYICIQNLILNDIVHLFGVIQCSPIMVVESKSLSMLCHQFMLMPAKESFCHPFGTLPSLDLSIHGI